MGIDDRVVVLLNDQDCCTLNDTITMNGKMEKPSKTTQVKSSGIRRVVIVVAIVLLAIFALFKIAEFFTESNELRQILPAIPGVISSIGKGAAAEKTDVRPVEAAIVKSTPRVISAEVKKSLNGFSVEVDVYLTVNEATPVTQEELLAVLTALWRNVPFEPDAVTIRAATEDNTIVDVKSASKMLTGVNVKDYNDYSTTIAQLHELLGPWKKPDSN